MSMSTEGTICYGVLVNSELILPWHDEGYEEEYEWWLKELNYKPKQNSENEHRDKLEFLEANPLPFEVINYCCESEPMFIFAAPSTVQKATRGYPKALKVKPVPTGVLIDPVISFCRQYGIQHEEPSWYLTTWAEF